MTPPTDLIQQYFQLAAGDLDRYFAQFAEDAVVEDEGRERHGMAEIRTWRTEVPRVTYAVQELVPTERGGTASAEIAGDFPGSPVVLHFRFEFDADDLISYLAIRP